jgi:periplasmic divalent cation tolerance protein
MADEQAIVVLMTAASFEEAGRIAETLVHQKLAACVQVLPEMQSIYLWKGEVQTDREVLMIAKTIHAKFAALEQQVRAMHSYETPEIIALQVVAGSESYLEWLFRSCEAS